MKKEKLINLKIAFILFAVDVWDDANETQPVVYHGYTMTSKILLQGVLQTINEVAFATSPYPVILSIENRCKKLENHRKMAQLMKAIFKDRLYTRSVDPSETQFPSPEDLRYRIFIKGSKSEIVTRYLDDDMETRHLLCFEFRYFSRTAGQRNLSMIRDRKREIIHNQESIIENDVEEDDEINLKRNKRKLLVRFRWPSSRSISSTGSGQSDALLKSQEKVYTLQSFCAH